MAKVSANLVSHARQRFRRTLHRAAIAVILLIAGVAVIAALTSPVSPRLLGIIMSLGAVAGLLFFLEAVLIVGRIWKISFRNWRQGKKDTRRHFEATVNLIVTSAISVTFAAIPLAMAVACTWHAVRFLRKGT